MLFVTFMGIFAKDLYGVLGLTRDATDQQIKKAFRKLSMKYHPDKNPGDKSAHDKFLEINEANDILSNPDKRQIYDIDGYEALKNPNQNRGHDPFAMFHGGRPGGRPKGPNAMTEMTVTLEQLYNGAKHTLNIERNVICSKCRGTGARDGQTEKCPVCGGRGAVVKTQTLGPGFQVQMQQPCDHCHGKGQVAKNKCPVCSGRRVVAEKKALEVVIERGMSAGDKIIFERESEQSPNTTPGDVIVILQVAPHPRFTRTGNDLQMNLTVSLKEALLGFKKSFRHMDGREVFVESDKIVKPFQVIVVKGEGMPMRDAPSMKGDLHVKVHVNFPDTLTTVQRDTVLKLL